MSSVSFCKSDREEDRREAANRLKQIFSKEEVVKVKAAFTELIIRDASNRTDVFQTRN